MVSVSRYAVDGANHGRLSDEADEPNEPKCQKCALSRRVALRRLSSLGAFAIRAQVLLDAPDSDSS